MGEKKTVLLVCTGNTCRSPMAMGLLRRAVGEDNYEITSAGTGAIDNAPASDKAIEVMRSEEIDISSHISKTLNGDLLDEADIVLVMTRAHRRQIVCWFKSSEKKTHLLREFDPVTDDSDYPDIPDPIGKDLDYYERVKEMIGRSIEGVKKIL
ncbi:MAG: low molecular weight protein arginine phosphatase [Thermoplasmata archaeon]|nr:low molecular weight protein arginine phosphatase [Thermoplasmata archaeon]